MSRHPASCTGGTFVPLQTNLCPFPVLLHILTTFIASSFRGGLALKLHTEYHGELCSWCVFNHSAPSVGHSPPPRGYKEEVDGQPLRLVPMTERPQKRLRVSDDDAEDMPKFKYTAMPITAHTPSSDKVSTPVPTAVVTARPAGPSKEELAAIVARATEAAEAARAAEAKAATEAAEVEERKRLAKQRKRERAERKEKEQNRLKQKNSVKPSSSQGEKAVDKDKRLVKLVGEVVVKYMSHYKDQMSHDVFKKHAKEVG